MRSLRSPDPPELPSALRSRLKELQDLLSAHGIEFALLFGSFSRGVERPWSDIDIGIYPSTSLSPLELGELIALLEQALGRDVDLIPLDAALEHNPALAYQAIAGGNLLFCRDPQRFVEFKRQAIMRYLDTAYLRAIVEQAFRERLPARPLRERPEDA